METALAFDDVLLVPKYSEIKSRLDVDTSTEICGKKLKIPFISSPMDTVTESEMAIAIGKAGGMGIVHRFMSIEENIAMIRKVIEAKNQFDSVIVAPSVGVTEEERRRFIALWLEFGKDLDLITIDVANGHSLPTKQMIDFVRGATNEELPILAGNVATYEGFEFLAELGVKAIRVGVGSGAICKTRIQTGFGVSLLQSLLNIQFYSSVLTEKHCGNYNDVAVIADGGIHYPADVVKSIVAGANAVICGSLFAGTQEAPGEMILDNEGKAWKRYRGMASAEVQQEKRGGMKPGTCAEGVSTLVPYKGSLHRVLDEFVGGLRSGMTYGNAKTLKELAKVQMVQVTSSGLQESHAHGTRMR